jgi:hypothetical protein
VAADRLLNVGFLCREAWPGPIPAQPGVKQLAPALVAADEGGADVAAEDRGALVAALAATRGARIVLGWLPVSTDGTGACGRLMRDPVPSAMRRRAGSSLAPKNVEWSRIAYRLGPRLRKVRRDRTSGDRRISAESNTPAS